MAARKAYMSSIYTGTIPLMTRTVGVVVVEGVVVEVDLERAREKEGKRAKGKGGLNAVASRSGLGKPRNGGCVRCGG